MRVVAGIAGSIPLLTPKTDIRPTMDLVRGAVFSMLGEAVLHARVLDLFAGTGAFGIEALSRGANSAVFVDSSRECIEIIKKNLAKTRLDSSAHIHQADVFSALDRHLLVSHAPFNIIFADPPYLHKSTERDIARELLFHKGLPELLAPNGILVLETASFWCTPEKIRWITLREKKYGKATIRFLVLPPNA